MIEYYGPHYTVVQKINKILNILATGDEQDWEVEMANPEGVDEMIDVLVSDKGLTIDEQAALSLLVISSLDEGASSGKLNAFAELRLKEFFLRNLEVYGRMKFYWIGLKKISSEHLKEFLFEH